MHVWTSSSNGARGNERQSNFWWATPNFHCWVNIVAQNSIDHGHWVPWLLHILLENCHRELGICVSQEIHWVDACIGDSKWFFWSFPRREAGMSSKCHATKTLASWRPLLCQDDIAKFTKWKCYVSPLGSSQSQNVISIQNRQHFTLRQCIRIGLRSCCKC